MASSQLNLKHPQFQVINQVPVGFSWTVFFFGFFPPIFRGDWKWGLIIFVLAIFTLSRESYFYVYLQ